MIGPIVAFVIGIAGLGWGFFAQRKRDIMAATPTLSCAEVASRSEGVV